MKKTSFFILAIALLLFETVSCKQENLYYNEEENSHATRSFISEVNRNKKECFALTGDIQVLKSYVDVNENDKEIQFYDISAPQESNYYFTLWIMPAKGAEYYMVINGYLVPGKFLPMKDGWQCVHLYSADGKKAAVPLNKGKNVIGIYSSLDELPEIEIVNGVINEEDSFISSCEYDKMIERINESNSGNVFESPVITTRSVNSALTTSPYTLDMQYQYELNCPVNYTTTKTVYSTSSTTLTVKISSATGAVVVDIYKDNYGAIESRLCLPTSSVTFSTVIPQGTTQVHLRRWNHYPEGITALTLTKGDNTPTTYPICVFSGYNIQVEPPYFSGSLNYFTCCNTNGVDPVLFLEDGTSDPSPVGYRNDDFPLMSDFNWGKNARILANSTNSNITEAHIFKTSSNSPSGTCDVYLGLPCCPLDTIFPNYKVYDAIISGDGFSNLICNCIGWAGDLFSYVWPPEVGSPYHISNNPLECFDFYFSTRGYTRNGANETNAAVALWGHNSSTFRHASIRNNTQSSYPHGYEWESKAGSWFRIFHPRDALANDNIFDAYGHILYYYTPIVPETQSNVSNETEEIEIRHEDTQLLDNYISEIPLIIKNKFEELYKQWYEACHTPPLVFVSNPALFMECPEYKKLLLLSAQNTDEFLLLSIEKVFSKDVFACYLMSSILPQKYAFLMKEAFVLYERDMEVIPTYEGNMIRLSSLILRNIKK